MRQKKDKKIWNKKLLDNGFVAIPNILLDYQDLLNITDAELLFILKICRFSSNWKIHDRDINNEQSTRTFQRRRASLKKKGYLQCRTIKHLNSSDEKNKYYTEGIMYDLSKLSKLLEEFMRGDDKIVEKSDKIVETRDKIVEKSDTDGCSSSHYLHHTIPITLSPSHYLTNFFSEKKLSGKEIWSKKVANSMIKKYYGWANDRFNLQLKPRSADIKNAQDLINRLGITPDSFLKYIKENSDSEYFSKSNKHFSVWTSAVAVSRYATLYNNVLEEID